MPLQNLPHADTPYACNAAVQSSVILNSASRTGGVVHAEDSSVYILNVSAMDPVATSQGAFVAATLASTIQSVSLRVIRPDVSGGHGGVLWMSGDSKADLIDTVVVDPVAAAGHVLSTSDTSAAMLTIMNVSMACDATSPSIVELFHRDDTEAGAYHTYRGVTAHAPGCNLQNTYVVLPTCYESTASGSQLASFQHLLQNLAEETMCSQQSTICVDAPIATGSNITTPTCACAPGAFAASTYISEHYSPYNPTSGCLIPLEADKIIRTSDSVFVTLHKLANEKATTDVNLTLRTKGTDLNRAAGYSWQITSAPAWIMPLLLQGPVATLDPVAIPVRVSTTLLASGYHSDFIKTRVSLSGAPRTFSTKVEVRVTAEPSAVFSAFVSKSEAQGRVMSEEQGDDQTVQGGSATQEVAAGSEALVTFSAKDVDGLPITEGLLQDLFSVNFAFVPLTQGETLPRDAAELADAATVVHVEDDLYAVKFMPLRLGFYTLALQVREHGELVDTASTNLVAVLKCASRRAINALEECVCDQGFERSAEGTCVPCPHGSSKAVAGNDACIRCGTGSFAQSTGAIECSRCAPGYVQPLMGQTTPCNQCPPGKTSIEGSAKCDICPSGSYDRNHPAGSDGSGGGPEALECRSCIANAVCIADATIATINITAGMWRASDRSDILYPCIKRGQVTPCLGGVTVGEAGDGYCTAGTSGALCQTCTNKTHFFNRKGARCEQCPEISDQVGIWLAVLGGVASVSLLVFFIHRLLPPWQRDALKSFSTRWNIILSHELAVVPKAKLILSTIQVTLALPSVYAVRMPETYQQFFAGAADAFSLDLELLPVECWWGGTVNKLFFDGLWPIALTACIYVGSCISSISKSRRSMRAAVKAGALESLPWVLVVTFSVAPVTAGRAFAAWTCDQIVVDSLATPREVRSFLRADMSVECFDSVAHQRLVAIAIAFVCIYPVGVPVAYLLMMRHLRHSIYEGRSTRLVSATGFLHAEYRRSKFFWEPVALLYRLVLVGFVQLIPPEYGFLRIIMALLVSMSYSVLLAHAVPFKRQEHNVMALLSQSLLIAYLMGVLCIKLFQDASDFGLSLGYPRLASDLIGLSSDGAISNVLVAATFVLILVFVAILVVQATRLHKGAIILLAATKRPPDLTLADAMKYHLFLSHVWSSAQDQVAVIKRQLLLMLQGNVSIFLDVDDLKDIGDLGKYVHASQVRLRILPTHKLFTQPHSAVCRVDTVRFMRFVSPRRQFSSSSRRGTSTVATA